MAAGIYYEEIASLAEVSCCNAVFRNALDIVIEEQP